MSDKSKTIKVSILGKPTTIGELKKLIEKFPDETSFGFRNQPSQELGKIETENEILIFFQETQE